MIGFKNTTNTNFILGGNLEYKSVSREYCIVPGRISTVGPGENLGRFFWQWNFFPVLINELAFHGTNGSPILPICLQYSLLLAMQTIKAKESIFSKWGKKVVDPRTLKEDVIKKIKI